MVVGRRPVDASGPGGLPRRGGRVGGPERVGGADRRHARRARHGVRVRDAARDSPTPSASSSRRLYLGYAASAIERERLLAEVSPAQPRAGDAPRHARDPRRSRARRGRPRRSRCSRSAAGWAPTRSACSSRSDGDARVPRAERRPPATTAPTTRRRGGCAPPADDDPVGDGDDGRRPAGRAPTSRPCRSALPEGRAALVAHWRPATGSSGDTLELLDDASTVARASPWRARRSRRRNGRPRRCVARTPSSASCCRGSATSCARR